MTAGDPIAEVDAQIAEIAPSARAPAPRRREVIAVTGPWLAGATAVASALLDRLPHWPVREVCELTPGDAPSALVFVVSAASALTASDCALLDAAATDTDLVIGVVSKIDVHRQWPAMRQAASETLAEYAPRYRNVAWVGVAAAPLCGDPRVEELVAALVDTLGSSDTLRRNRLRSWESKLSSETDRIDRDARGQDRSARVATVQEHRETLARQRRESTSEQMICLRSGIAQARVQLSAFARKRCASVRGELAEDAAGMNRRRLPEFEDYVRDRHADVIAEVDEGITEHLADLAGELALSSAATGSTAPSAIETGAPVLASRALETQLMLVLGAGFGLGLALTLSRIFDHLAPGLSAAGAVACTAIGIAVTVWVVRVRGLLADRAALQRWVGDCTTALSSALQETVALRVVDAEAAFSAEVAARIRTESARAAERIAVLDRELREHAAATARAVRARDRHLPALQRALQAVRAELADQAD